MEFKSSYHQTRLWFIDSFEAGKLYEAGPVYHNISLIFKIKGEINLLLLENSIKAVIQRHGALRTKIITKENEPFQVIETETALKLEYLDLTGYPVDNIKQHALDLAINFSQKAFALDRDSLVRASFIRLPGEESLLVIGIHHIIADYYSLTIIANEIFTHYDAYRKNETPVLQPLPAHYIDFSQWQYRLTDDMLEPILYYWKKILKGPLQPLELPTDRPRATIHIYHEGHLQFNLNSNLPAKMERFCLQYKSSKELILLTIFKLLLAKYSGQEEILVGITDDNRNQTGLEHIVGPLANLLVLRTFLDETADFKQVLDNISETVRGARKYKDIPFEKLDLELKPPKDMSRTVFFDVLFQFREKSKVKIFPDGLEIDTLETNLGYGKYDLNLLLLDDMDCHSITGYLVYNRDYYNESTIQRFVTHYVRLLENCLENPQQKISELHFLTEEEMNRLLYDFNAAPVEYPRDKTIHGLFEDQVKKAPEAIAVFGRGQTRTDTDNLTYRQLDDKANRLAARLRETGVGPDIIVALKVERSLEMIVGIMGILKAGGAYLPIDPFYPHERIKFMIGDSGTRLLLNENLGIEIIKPFEGLNNMGNSLSAPSVQSHHLAYVIFTSGTTGRPKGALIEHRNVVQLLFHEAFRFNFDAGDTWTLFHSYCFDFSVWEMYGALLYGGKLVVIPRMTAMDTKKFLELLWEHKVTVLNQTPSAFYRLADEELKQDTPRLELKYVIFGGEALNPGKLKEWQARYPNTKLINMFGITETTVHVTYKEITDREIELAFSNIGRPLPTLNVYIVDRQMNMVPIGVPGEMLVGGIGVCRGYLNRMGLTTERFIKYRSYGSYKTYILYKTGDLARFTDSGDIIYLGRIDAQVKIRGHRIELGEIEKQLLRYGPVKEAVVIERHDKNSDKYLCAYVVLDTFEGSAATPFSELRDYLLKRLPNYMVPPYYVILDRIPLTANGKVDRGALPGPEIDAGIEYVAPRNEVETGIVYILSEILGIDKSRISVRANFFDIGINSVSLLKVAHRISEEFRIDFPISTLFIHPTVEEVVEDMKKGYHPGVSRRAVLLNRKIADRNLFLLSADGRIYIFKALAALLEGHFNVYGVMARGLMDTCKLPETRQELYDDFIAEIKLAQPEGPYLLGGYCFGAITSYELTRVLEERKNKVAKLVLLDEPAVMTDYVIDHIARYRWLNRYLNTLQKLKKTARSVKMKFSRDRDVHAKKQKTDEIVSTVMPEDLEAQRVQIDKNYRRLLSTVTHFSRIVKAPILAVKTDGSDLDPDPRWNPNTIARLSKTSVEQVKTPGDHFSFVEAPYVSSLAKLLIEKI